MSSFGEELRRERELREISLAEVAEATKINVRFLEAIERNDFECLPGGLYNRGIVRAYCQFIGADSEAMVNAYLLEEQTRAARNRPGPPGLVRGRGAGDPVPVDAVPHGPAREALPRWLWVAAIVLALVACLILYITLVRDEDKVSGAMAPAVDDGSAAPAGERAHGGGIG
jgi:transcriptional regulator with XRE-family HTH domain